MKNKPKFSAKIKKESNQEPTPVDQENEEHKDQELEQGQVTVEVPKKEKKKSEIFRFKPDMITDPKKGLIFLYESLGQVNFDTQTNFNEIKELDKYIKLIEDWHYYTVPKYDFQYFTSRCQKFGAQGVVKNQIDQMRKAHKGIIPWDFIKQSSNPNGIIEEPEQQFDAHQAQTYSGPVDNRQFPDQQVYDYIQSQINNVDSAPIPQINPTRNNKKLMMNLKPLNKINAHIPVETNQIQEQQPSEENIDFLDDLFGQIEDFEQLKEKNKKVREI